MRLGGGDLIERLRNLGFRERDGKHEVMYEVTSSRAAELARRMLSDALIKALVEDLGSLPDAEKLRNLITLANMRVKPLSRSSIEVVGMRIHVHVYQSGFVELRVVRNDYDDAVEVLTRLKNAGYEEAKLSKRGDSTWSTWAWTRSRSTLSSLVRSVRC
ncbi:hypothetical protein [Vulcanisaeta distributa]|uniref:hypothetical protein n=1 Tax=Vulcanisaeta distributa TaxID=164451 RepID=UPI0006D1CB57|nr:hypothetical protein [Vulcanisaeta distributa]